MLAICALITDFIPVASIRIIFSMTQDSCLLKMHVYSSSKGHKSIHDLKVWCANLFNKWRSFWILKFTCSSLSLLIHPLDSHKIYEKQFIYDTRFLTYKDISVLCKQIMISKSNVQVFINKWQVLESPSSLVVVRQNWSTRYSWNL